MVTTFKIVIFLCLVPKSKYVPPHLRGQSDGRDFGNQQYDAPPPSRGMVINWPRTYFIFCTLKPSTFAEKLGILPCAT